MNFWSRQRQPGGLFTYKGRIGRKKYTICFLFYGIFLDVFLYLINRPDFVSVFVSTAAYIVVLMLSTLNMMKRLHDVNLSGLIGIVIHIVALFVMIFLWDIVNFLMMSPHRVLYDKIVSVVGFINLGLYIFLLFKKGTAGPNKYGNDPLQKVVAEET